MPLIRYRFGTTHVFVTWHCYSPLFSLIESISSLEPERILCNAGGPNGTGDSVRQQFHPSKISSARKIALKKIQTSFVLILSLFGLVVVSHTNTIAIAWRRCRLIDSLLVPLTLFLPRALPSAPRRFNLRFGLNHTLRKNKGRLNCLSYTSAPWLRQSSIRVPDHIIPRIIVG